MWSFKRERWLLAIEHLTVVGMIPWAALCAKPEYVCPFSLDNISDRVLKSFAGNAMSLPVVGICELVMLCLCTPALGTEVTEATESTEG